LKTNLSLSHPGIIHHNYFWLNISRPLNEGRFPAATHGTGKPHLGRPLFILPGKPQQTSGE
ncbi:hypothetical protein ACFL43_07235, partial [Thermodesulfobacteriota bacterium]